VRDTSEQVNEGNWSLRSGEGATEAGRWGARRILMRKRPWWCSIYGAASTRLDLELADIARSVVSAPVARSNLIKDRDINATIAPR
jgi:hypothetical protein